jgi:hypothetical protein
MREPHAGGAAKVEGFIGERVMAHPRHGVVLHTVYITTRGRQPEFGPGRFMSLPDPVTSS